MKVLEKYKDYVDMYDSDEFYNLLDQYKEKYKEPPVILVYYQGRKLNYFTVGFSDNICPTVGLPKGLFTRQEIYDFLINIKDKINIIVYGTRTNSATEYRGIEINALIKKISRGMRD